MSAQALTVQEIADLERVHYTTIRAEIAAGRLTARRIGDARTAPIRIDPADYEAWKAARTIRPTGQTTKKHRTVSPLRAVEGGRT